MIIDDDVLAAAARLAGCEANYSRSMSQRRDRVIAAATTNTPQPAEKTTPARSIPTNEALIAEFERSPALQSEFMSFECFSAYRRAEARGAIKLLRRVA